MKFSFKLFFITLLLSSALISCQQQGKDQTSGASKKGTTIATVNGNPVTDEDVKFEISQLPDSLQEMAATTEGLTSLLDDILKKEMLYQEAMKQDMDKSDEYQKQLKELKRRLVVQMLLTEEVEKKTSVTDEEVKEFYDDNREQFVSPSSKGKEEAVPFERVKDLIKNRLLQQKQRTAFQNYLDSLSKTYAVELKKDAIAKTFGISIGNITGIMENNAGNDGESGTDLNKEKQSVPKTKNPEEAQ